MGVVLLVRHAQASFGTEDYDRLSDVGQAQARRLGTVLAERGVRPDHAICGTLERQRETLETCLEAIGADPSRREDARWNEYDHLGLLAAAPRADPTREADDGDRPGGRRTTRDGRGRDRPSVAAGSASDSSRAFQAALDRALVTWIAAGDGAPGGGFPAFRGDASAALDEAATRSGTTLVVSSAGAIVAACAGLLGIGAEHWITLQRVVVNASLTKVIAGRRGVHLVSFNEHGHLEGSATAPVTYR